jgi:mRNA interferase MazF
VWLADLNPTRGREQAGQRPALVISDDIFNQGPADLCIVLPITSTPQPIPSHIRLVPPDGGLKVESAVLCEAVRSVSRGRLLRQLGAAKPETLDLVEGALKILMGL